MVMCPKQQQNANWNQVEIENCIVRGINLPRTNSTKCETQDIFAKKQQNEHTPGTRHTPLGPDTHPPGPGTHPPGTRHTPPGNRYTPWDQVHPPGADTPRPDMPREQVHPPGAKCARRYGQRAGGPHPTGMHSC